MRVVFWGTYDVGKARVRILLAGLKENDVDVIECHADIWAGIEDKTQVSGIFRRSLIVLRWLACYPRLIWQYMRTPAHDVVVIGYFGHLDVLVLWPFAKLRRVPMVWDTFISLYNTVVEDRKIVGSRNPLALICYGWEWLATRAATTLLMDTAVHAAYLEELYRLPAGKVQHVYVGAETGVFHRTPGTTSPDKKNSTGVVLFYGQFIPLHGIDTIIEAASLWQNQSVRFCIIGQGQEYKRIRALANQLGCRAIDWIDWISYADLVLQIRKADVCLGIFGTTRKAQLVIPNKAFQIAACGRPIVTAKTPAIEELFTDYPRARLVPAGDARAIVQAIDELLRSPTSLDDEEALDRFARRISPSTIGIDLKRILQTTVEQRAR